MEREIHTHDLIEQIRNALQEEESGISSCVLAERFFKIKTSAMMADLLVTKILASDPLFFCEGDVWKLRVSGANLLRDLTTYVCAVEYVRDISEVTQIALWEIRGRNVFGVEGGCGSLQDLVFLQRIMPFLQKNRVFFSDSFAQRIVRRDVQKQGCMLGDDTVLLGTLWRMAHGGNVDALAEPVWIDCTRSASLQGETLALLVLDFYDKIAEQGIVSIEDWGKYDCSHLTPFEEERCQFSLADIEKIPELLGVYGFRDYAGEMLYVGKACNMRLRLLSYCRSVKMLPQICHVLRRTATTVSTHVVQSEIEAFLLEHRLASKYNPPLNPPSLFSEQDLLVQELSPMIIIHQGEYADSLQILLCGSASSISIFTYKIGEELPMNSEMLQDFFYEKPFLQEGSIEKSILAHWIRSHSSQVYQLDILGCDTGEELHELLQYHTREYLSRKVSGQ